MKKYGLLRHAQSHTQRENMWRAFNLTAFIHSSTGPVVRPFASPHEGPGFPRRVLMWNRDSPVSVVSLHWWPQRDWSLWPHLRRASSLTVTRPSCWQCDNPTWPHTALLSRFHARWRSSFRRYNGHSPLLGRSFVESLQSHCIHTQFHWSSGPPVCFPSWGTCVQSPGGVLKWNRDSPVSVFSLQIPCLVWQSLWQSGTGPAPPFPRQNYWLPCKKTWFHLPPSYLREFHCFTSVDVFKCFHLVFFFSRTDFAFFRLSQVAAE
jgi:hypothetical protein